MSQHEIVSPPEFFPRNYYPIRGESTIILAESEEWIRTIHAVPKNGSLFVEGVGGKAIFYLNPFQRGLVGFDELRIRFQDEALPYPGCEFIKVHNQFKVALRGFKQRRGTNPNLQVVLLT